MRLDSGKPLKPRVPRSDWARPYDTGKPLAASSTAGCTNSAHAFLPYFLLAYSRPRTVPGTPTARRSEEHTSELQSLRHLVCRLLLEKKKKYTETLTSYAQAIFATLLCPPLSRS